MKRLLLFVFVISSFGFNSIAQRSYSFLQVNNLDGLVSDRVTCVLKDSRGFIWIGTKSGLSRYDGANIVNYKHDSNDSTSIIDNYILNLQEDYLGNLVVLTSHGYVFFDTKREKFIADVNKYFGLKAGLPFIESIYCDKNKVFWLKRHQQVYYQRLDSIGMKPVRVLNTTKPRGVDPLFFKQFNKDYYYLFSDGTIECYEGKTFSLKFTDDFLLGQVSRGSFDPGLFVDKDGDLWFYGNDNGVFHFNSKRKTWNHYSVKSDRIKLSSNLIYKVVQDGKGLIWIATDHGGINIINKLSGSVTVLKHQQDNDKSIAHNSVTDLYVDNSGMVWAGTNKNGVSYYHESLHKFPHYGNLLSDKSSLPFSDVNCFAEDENGNLWIGTNGGGLIYYNRKTKVYTSYKHNKNDSNSISSNIVVSLYIDRDQVLWVGTFAGGLNRFDGEKFHRYTFNTPSARGLRNNNIWSIIEDNRKRLWLATMGAGIQVYDRKTDTFSLLANKGQMKLPTTYVSQLLKLSDGNIMIGTAYGAFLYDVSEKCFKNLPGTENISGLDFISKSVNGIFEDSRGLLWGATFEGLFVIDPRSGFVKQFSSSDGLPEDIINCIQEDEFQTIWISKSTGLSQIMVSKAARDKPYNFQVYHFTEEDGLQANEFNPNASFKTRDSELIFGGVNGFNLFRSRDIKVNTKLPKVVFTDFQVYNKSIKPGTEVNNQIVLKQSITSTKKLTIKHSMNVFSIDFAALDFLIPKKIKYKYKLEGFNENWLTLDNTRPRVTYTNLNAGEYVFKVKASNNDGVWNNEYTELHIRVLPPFYASAFAYVVYGLIIAFLLVYFRYSMLSKERIRFAIEQERLQAKQNHEMDEMKLRFLTNVSHEFRTPLTLILTPLQKLLGRVTATEDRKLLEVIDGNAKNLLGLVNQLLDFRKLELHGLRYNPSYGDIIAFLQAVAKNFEDGFRKKNIEFVFEHDESSFMLDFDRDKLEKVMMNLLSNALKFTPEKGKVSIRFEVEEVGKKVRILVSDSGIGIKKDEQEQIFQRFYQSERNQKMGVSGSGIGLNLAREMVLLHKGSIGVESDEEKGATFIVSLPIENTQREVEIQPKQDEEIIGPEKVEVAKGGKPVILLVEDNADFRGFMKETLQEKFTVYDAPDGQIGYDKVHEVHPDIVISDVMMPKVDGLELCRRLRKDIRTSHIPFVLLTARTADEDKIKGLETGADEYMTKPFNVELLLLRVNNLLKKRGQMQEQFQQNVEIAPSEVQITSMDEKLIQKAVAIVEEKISESDFTVEDFSKQLGMSRVYLYKKLTSITGKSPIEFIRIIRLKRGAQLLEKSQMTISEVAYQVGFNNPRYFSKYFKEEYGMLPTAYIKAKKGEA